MPSSVPVGGMRMSVRTTSGESLVDRGEQTVVVLARAATTSIVVARLEKTHDAFTHEIAVLGDHDADRHARARRLVACASMRLGRYRCRRARAVSRRSSSRAQRRRTPGRSRSIHELRRHDHHQRRRHALSIREVIDYDFGVVPQARHLPRHPVALRLPEEGRHRPRLRDRRRSRCRRPRAPPPQYRPRSSPRTTSGTSASRSATPTARSRGKHTYDITYRVKGALNGFADHDELYWNAIGQQWAVHIDSANVTRRMRRPTITAGRLLRRARRLSTLPCESSRVGRAARRPSHRRACSRSTV